MKAKTYIKNFTLEFEECYDKLPEELIKEKIAIIGQDFVKEFNNMIVARNIGKGSNELSLVNLIKEFNNKWKNVVLKINNYFENKFDVTIMSYSGFLGMLKIMSPTYYDIIDRYKIK